MVDGSVTMVCVRLGIGWGRVGRCVVWTVFGLVAAG